MKVLYLALALAIAVDAKSLMPKRRLPIEAELTVREPRDARVVNGTDANEGQFPYQAYFNTGPYLCGASILDADTALTACHCCDGIQPSQMFISAGGLNRNNLEQRVGVSSKTEHPSYNSRTFENDVCILQLSSNLNLNDNTVAAIRLAPSNTASDHYVGQTTVVTGWGTTEPGGSVANNLQYSEETIWSDEQCNQSLYGLFGADITGDMICAGDGSFDENRDSCQGDSGGPLALGDANTRWEDREQVGIVSWGYSCAKNGLPGVYSDVPYLRDWIDANA